MLPVYYFKNFLIRPIQKNDNLALANLIRRTLEEFKANKCGTVYYDKTTDDLYNLFFQKEKAAYWSVELNGEIIGGAGIYPTANLPDKMVELVKLYLYPTARKTGLGKFLMELCESQARLLGYEKIYLETMPELIGAVSLYKSLGYINIENSLGNSGHTGCGIWMIKNIANKN